MMLRKMYGVEMEVPSGKLPGYYAQVVHKIGDQIEVFDRDGQLLIVSTENDRNSLVDILEKHLMAGEQFELWLLPPETDAEAVGDYGFISMSGHVFLYTYLVDAFTFDPAFGSAQDRFAALQQMKEHIIHSLPEATDEALHLIDKNHDELIAVIANAYQVKFVWPLA